VSWPLPCSRSYSQSSAHHREQALARRGNGNANTNSKNILIFWIALMLVNKNETTRVGETFYPFPFRVFEAFYTTEAWNEGSKFLRQRVGFFTEPSSLTSVTSTLVSVTLSIFALVIHLISSVTEDRFKHRLCVANATKAEMADIGLGCNKGHG